MEPRKIIQIAATPSTSDEHHMLYALCNDGTLWYGNGNVNKTEWVPIEPVPDAVGVSKFAADIIASDVVKLLMRGVTVTHDDIAAVVRKYTENNT